MAPKTKRMLISETLEDLRKQNLDKFRDALLDRREEPRIRRNRVEDKGYLDITDVLVSTFTESGAVTVVEELLRQIGCNEEADELVKATRGPPPEPGASDNDHFVDKHRLELIQRVATIAPILDELLSRKVIQQEGYDEIRAQPTTQEKMRKLYSVGLKAGPACKEIFYKALEKNEPLLIEDLKKKK